MISTCKCKGGYEGYGCTDDLGAVPSQYYITSAICLTCSNLFFLIPIFIAFERKLYIEAVNYFYNMVVSIFYHACDQELFSYCLFNYDGLQLADFISSYTSFLITILAIAKIKRTWKLFSYFFGLLSCISICIYRRFNFKPFIFVFLCTMFFTLITLIKRHGLKLAYIPTRRLFFKHFLPGVTLSTAGIFFFFLSQNKESYWLYHSLWHICISSSVVFFIPKKKKIKVTELIMETRI